MRIGKLRITILVILCFIAIFLVVRRRHHTPASPPSQHGNSGTRAGIEYVLLPPSEVTTYAKVFSGDPKAEVQSWEPTVADIEGLEANLPQISSLTESKSDSRRHIDDPRSYIRQYVAIMQAGKPQIFVNAFCSNEAPGFNEWHRRLEVVADGGTCFWHAVYDPSTEKFSDLEINGRA